VTNGASAEPKRVSNELLNLNLIISITIYIGDCKILVCYEVVFPHLRINPVIMLFLRVLPMKWDPPDHSQASFLIIDLIATKHEASHLPLSNIIA